MTEWYRHRATYCTNRVHVHVHVHTHEHTHTHTNTNTNTNTHTHTHTHTHVARTTRVSRYQKGKINLDFTEARDSECSGISWGICKSALCSSNPTLSFFYRPDALPAAQPTASKHWRDNRVQRGENQSGFKWCKRWQGFSMAVALAAVALAGLCTNNLQLTPDR